jgi:hypothetical protein
MSSWNGPGVGHIAHSNSRAGLSYDQQMACSSNAGDLSLSRTNEIVCFRLDGSMQVLVVAPNMTDLNASGGGGDAYSKRPKGNIDPTGEYFLWASNMGGGRADVFVVRIPAHLLNAPGPAPGPAPAAGPAPTPAPTPTPAPAPGPAPAPAPGPVVADPIQWMFTVNVSAASNNLVKTGGCDGCPDASGVSSGQVNGNGIAQFVAPETGTLRFVGLGYGGPGTAPGDINFALRLQNGVAEVRESNAYRTEIGFAVGDTLAIVVTNNVIKYSKNGAVFYTSPTQATSPLRLHAVLFNVNGAVNGIGIGGAATPAAPTPPPAAITPTPAPNTPTNVFRRAGKRGIRH